MITFEKYPHINALFNHYIEKIGDKKISAIFDTGVANADDARMFSEFVWKMVAQMNKDDDENILVLGSTDNTEMFPDLNYEVTAYMKKVGFYSVWERVSENEL